MTTHDTRDFKRLIVPGLVFTILFALAAAVARPKKPQMQILFGPSMLFPEPPGAESPSGQPLHAPGSADRRL